MDHFLLLSLLMFSILLNYAFDFHKKFPSFYFVYSAFMKTSHWLRISLVHGSSKAWISSSLDSSLKGLVEKVHEKWLKREDGKLKASQMKAKPETWLLRIFSLLQKKN